MIFGVVNPVCQSFFCRDSFATKFANKCTKVAKVKTLYNISNKSIFNLIFQFYKWISYFGERRGCVVALEKWSPRGRNLLTVTTFVGGRGEGKRRNCPDRAILFKNPLACLTFPDLIKKKRQFYILHGCLRKNSGKDRDVHQFGGKKVFYFPTLDSWEIEGWSNWSVVFLSSNLKDFHISQPL